jgi:hypothetical protein
MLEGRILNLFSFSKMGPLAVYSQLKKNVNTTQKSDIFWGEMKI